MGIKDFIYYSMDILITGRIDEKTISEPIGNYQSHIPEQKLTAMKNIRKKFETLGYNPDDVTFD